MRSCFELILFALIGDWGIDRCWKWEKNYHYQWLPLHWKVVQCLMLEQHTIPSILFNVLVTTPLMREQPMNGGRDTVGKHALRGTKPLFSLLPLPLPLLLPFIFPSLSPPLLLIFPSFSAPFHLLHIFSPILHYGCSTVISVNMQRPNFYCKYATLIFDPIFCCLF